MSRRYLPIAIVTALLLATGLAGYLIPAPKAEIPKRVLLQSAGGKVIFNHDKHVNEYGQECIACHHQGTASTEHPEQTVACGTCHAKTFDQTFVETHPDKISDEKLCVTCHHMEFGGLNFDHEAHEGYADDDCTACHHDESIDPEGPSKCSTCHTESAKGNRPALKTAAHERCESCHDDLFAEKTKGCASCHQEKKAAPADAGSMPCSTCHEEKVADLVPERTAAFHGQCMGCHEELGAGPYGDDACSRCHMK